MLCRIMDLRRSIQNSKEKHIEKVRILGVKVIDFFPDHAEYSEYLMDFHCSDNQSIPDSPLVPTVHTAYTADRLKVGTCPRPLGQKSHCLILTSGGMGKCSDRILTTSFRGAGFCKSAILIIVEQNKKILNLTVN